MSSVGEQRKKRRSSKYSTRAHTKTRPIKTPAHGADDNTPISADDFYTELFGDFPKWATYLSGLRHREELTQTQLADAIGVAQPNISEMERGKRPIGKNIAMRLAKLFKTDYRLFL